MTDTSALRAFIEARLAEDEATAKRTLADNVHGCWLTVPAQSDVGLHDAVADAYAGVRLASGPWYVNEHIARHDPARVLREVAVKRALLAMDVSPGEYNNDVVRGYYDAVNDVEELLASAWSDHPDYRTKWGSA
jgi:hypothetical protein